MGQGPIDMKLSLPRGAFLEELKELRLETQHTTLMQDSVKECSFLKLGFVITYANYLQLLTLGFGVYAC